MTSKTTETKTTKELQREDPEFLPTTYGLNKSKLAKLRKDYDVSNMPVSLIKGDEGYEIIHKKAMAIVKVRTNIEKQKKILTDDANKWRSLVNGEAKKFTELVEAIEKPWKDKKAELDNAQAIKEENERLAEQERTEFIESQINAIINTTSNLVGADTETLRGRLNLANMIVVDETYEEYETAALDHKNKAIEVLSAALTERENFEEQQEKLLAAQKELEELKKNNLINSGSTSNSANAGERATMLAQQFNNEKSDNFDMSEPVNSQESSGVRSEDVEPYINLTEPQMVVAYMESLIDVEVPDVGDERMVNLIDTMTKNLVKLQKFIQVHTQE